VIGGFEVVPKLQVRLKSKPATITADKAQSDEKAEHTRVVYEYFEEVCNAAIGP
jgi:hypothetical protein